MTHQPNNVSAAGVLMPCPFCGATPDLPDALGIQYEIECDCGMARSAVQISDLMTFEERQSGWDSFMLKFDAQYVERAKEEAIAAWNRRAAASAQATGQADRISDFSHNHRLLEWNRAQEKPPIQIGMEYGVAEAARKLLAAAPSPAAREAGDGVRLTDTQRLDWLDTTNKRFQMGWRVGVAPAGNVTVGTVVQLGGGITSIREAIDAALLREAGSR